MTRLAQIRAALTRHGQDSLAHVARDAVTIAALIGTAATLVLAAGAIAGAGL